MIGSLSINFLKGSKITEFVEERRGFMPDRIAVRSCMVIIFAFLPDNNFKNAEGENKILLLGDMFELGADAAIEHQTIVN